MRNKNGITLIVLVITIIVLLILAGVSLSLVLGDNGVLKQTKNATTATRNAEEMEKIRLEVLVSYDNNRNLDFEKLKSNINTHITEATAEGEEFPLTVTYESTRNVYKVNSNGDIDSIEDGDAEEKIKVERAVAAARAVGNGVLTTENLNIELDKVFNNGKQVEASKVRRLPAEYEEVEYIESTGIQYIDTGVKENTVYSFEFVFTPLKTNTTNYDSWLSGTIDNFTIGTYANITKLYLRHRTNEKTTNLPVSNNIPNTFKLSNNVVEINGVTVSCSTDNPVSTGTNNIFLLTNASKNRIAIGRIYSLKLYDKSNIIRDCIPCFRISDNVIGLYDLVEGKFYTNQNTSGADFTAGKKIETTETQQWNYKLASNRKYIIHSDGKVEQFITEELPSLLPPEYQQVEYIESTGTQYIDTKVYFSFAKDMRIIGEVINNDASKRKVIIGTYRSNAEVSYSLEFGGNSNSHPGYLRNHFEYYSANDFYSALALPTKEVISYNTYYNASNHKLETEYQYSDEIKTYEGTVMDLSNKDSKPLRFCLDYRANNSGIANPISIGKTEIYQDDDLINNFIPCYSTTTVTDVNGKQCPEGTKGLYDLVEGNFYTNKGSGDDFKAGPDVE